MKPCNIRYYVTGTGQRRNCKRRARHSGCHARVKSVTVDGITLLELSDRGWDTKQAQERTIRAAAKGKP